MNKVIRPPGKNYFLEKQIVLRVSRLGRVRRAGCLRAKRCTGALPVWRCSAGEQAAWVLQASVNQRSAAHPACASTASKRRKAAESGGKRRASAAQTQGPLPDPRWPPRPTKASAASACAAPMTTFHRRIGAGWCPVRARKGGGMGRALIYRVILFFSFPVTVCGPLPSTRAVSRVPLPFKARSVIFARTPGSRTWWR